MNSRPPHVRSASVRANYNDLNRYEIDPWHTWTAARVQHFTRRLYPAAESTRPSITINAGSGSKRLELDLERCVNIDFAENAVCHLPDAVVGSVEALPFRLSSIDAVICVGSVINYCDAIAVIQQFAAVLRNGGTLVLEFESSRSGELIRTSAFRQSAVVVTSFYGRREEVLWAYHPDYITRILNEHGFDLIRICPIHVLSPFVLFLSKSRGLASAAARLDAVASRIPGMSRWSSNFILSATIRK